MHMATEIDEKAVKNLHTLRKMLRDYALSEETPEEIGTELLKAHEHVDEATHKAERELWDPPLGAD